MGKFAIVGTGFTADRLLGAAATRPEHRFVGGWDEDVERLAAFSAHWSIPAARGLDDLFGGAKRPNLLVNLAPLAARAEVSRIALAAALPVWSAEPIAPTVAEADALVAFAAQHRAAIASGPSAALGPIVQTAVAAVRRRAVGTPELAVADWETGYLAQSPFAEWRSESGALWPAEELIREGVVLHHAGVPLAALLAMFGPVRTVAATTTTLVPDTGGYTAGPDYLSAVLTFDGILARLTVSTVGRRVSRLRVTGPRGTLVADADEGTVRIDRRNIVRGRIVEGWTRDPIRLSMPPGGPRLRWRSLPDAFFGPAEALEALEENRAPRLSGEAALHLTEVLLALNEAGLDAAPRTMTTAFEPILPMPWARRTRRREKTVDVIKIGIVGTGPFATDIVEAARHDPRLDFDAVVGRTQEEANAFASAGEIERAGTTLDVAFSGEIGAVVLTEPFSGEAALAALAAGKAVLAAAPFARSTEEAERLLAASREAGVPLLEALWSPFLPSHRRAVELARSGSLGNPVHLVIDLGMPVLREAHPTDYEAGALRALMPHALALALALFGEVEDVDAAVTEEGGTDVGASLLLRHKGGGVSQLAASLATLMSNSARIALTEGSIRIDDPVLAAESLAVKRVTSAPGTMGRMMAAPTLVAGARTEISQRLRRSGMVRRVGRAVSLPRTESAGYGAHQLSPLLNQFAALVTERRTESDVVPAARTLEIIGLIDAIRPSHARQSDLGMTPPAVATPVPEIPEPADAPAWTADVADAGTTAEAASAPATPAPAPDESGVAAPSPRENEADSSRRAD